MPAKKKTTTKTGGRKKGVNKTGTVKKDSPQQANSNGGFGQFIMTVVVTGLIVVVAVAIYAKLTGEKEVIIQENKPVVEEVKNNNEDLVGGQKDKHGCLAPAGYSWCEAQQKCLRTWEEWCEDEAFELVGDIEKNVGIKLEPKGPVDFDWLFEDKEEIEKLDIEGQKFTANGLEHQDYTKLLEYFNTNFKPDLVNVSAGTISEANGFVKGSLACVLSTQLVFDETKDYGDDLPPFEEATVNLELKCGFLDKAELPKLSDEQLIRNAIAKKHDKSVSMVEIDIDESTADYAFGDVTFLPKDPGNGGLFWATKSGDEWLIVADGNGIPECSLFEPYDFPEDMVGNCIEEVQE